MVSSAPGNSTERRLTRLARGCPVCWPGRAVLPAATHSGCPTRPVRRSIPTNTPGTSASPTMPPSATAGGSTWRGDVHSQGIESAWAILKRMHKGVYHQISPKHLHRYVNELAGRHNQPHQPPLARMAALVRGLVGQRLRYADLVAGGPAYQ